jgi:hypothetical protein
VKTIVRTGAMFSITCCLDSTSQAATITAPAAPEGNTQEATCSGRSELIGWRISPVSPTSTPPPRAMST